MGITWHYMELKFISIGEGFIMLLTTELYNNNFKFQNSVFIKLLQFFSWL